MNLKNKELNIKKLLNGESCPDFVEKYPMAEVFVNNAKKDKNSLGTPEMIAVVLTIKEVQKRIKELADQNYMAMYSIVDTEFSDFAERYTFLFVRVTKGQDLPELASLLYARDHFLRGLITESQLQKDLAKHFGF